MIKYLKRPAIKKRIKILWFFTLGILAGAVFLALVSLSLIFWLKKEYRDKVFPGVYVYSTLVSGKTREELKSFLAEKEKTIHEEKVIFYWQNNGEKRWEIIPQMIDFSINGEETAEKVFSLGRGQSGWSNLVEIYHLFLIPQKIEPEFAYNQENLKAIADQIAAEIDRPSQDALFEFKNGKVVNFQVSKEGFKVDTKLVWQLILLAFTQSSPRQAPLILSLPVEVVSPKVTTSETNRLGIKEFLAEGESFFNDSIPSRIYNIILASSYMHGVVIPPGEIFSFAEKIGTISAETGYQKAYVIKDKKTILEDGGGVCQVSTTMFRAALNAGLPIIERQAHYYRVGYYEQGGYLPGLDATVYPPSPDLKFKNDTQAYILIQTVVDQSKKRLAFRIYGTADGRITEMTKPKILSQTEPPEPLYVDEPTLPLGVVKKMDSAHWGAKVSFTRTVYNKDNSIKEEKTFWSNYVPWPAVYQRGTGTP